MAYRRLSDVGGTPGGLGSFLMGLILTCLGGYFLTSHVMVRGSYWSFGGANAFGISLVPMLLGVAMLFWNSRSLVAWLLTVAGALIVFAGILANLEIYFERTSLFTTLIMLFLLVSGLGLIARSMRSSDPSVL